MKAFTVSLAELFGDKQAQVGIEVVEQQGCYWLWLGNYDGRENNNTVGVPVLSRLGNKLKVANESGENCLSGRNHRRISSVSIAVNQERELQVGPAAEVSKYAFCAEQADESHYALVFFNLRNDASHKYIKSATVSFTFFDRAESFMLLDTRCQKDQFVEVVLCSSEFDDAHPESADGPIHWIEGLAVMHHGLPVEVCIEYQEGEKVQFLACFDGDKVVITENK
jgi:hypothetical protein